MINSTRLYTALCATITIATFGLHSLSAMETEGERITKITNFWKKNPQNSYGVPSLSYCPWNVTKSINALQRQLGQDEAVKLLQKCFVRANVRLIDVKAPDNWTILHYACENLQGNVENVKIVLRIASDQSTLWSLLAMQDANGSTALHVAVRAGRKEAVKALLQAAGPKKCAFLAIVDAKGQVAMNIAQQRNDSDMIHILQQPLEACEPTQN